MGLLGLMGLLGTLHILLSPLDSGSCVAFISQLLQLLLSLFSRDPPSPQACKPARKVSVPIFIIIANIQIIPACFCFSLSLS